MIHVVFYVAAAALVLVIFSYAAFYVKTYIEKQKMAALDQKIALYGNGQQKQDEKTVLDQQKKINDFTKLIQNHKISSNVFTFLEANTLPGVVFSSLNMSQITNELRLSGEADSMATLGKQFTIFENATKYIQNISVLNSQTAASGKTGFVLNISLEPSIFTYANQ